VYKDDKPCWNNYIDEKIIEVVTELNEFIETTKKIKKLIPVELIKEMTKAIQENLRNAIKPQNSVIDILNKNNIKHLFGKLIIKSTAYRVSTTTKGEVALDHIAKEEKQGQGEQNKTR
tara:strand:- start:8417 stop:8770 length:354 start_codon:yes stop_codon:yes gene_type:complete